MGKTARRQLVVRNPYDGEIKVRGRRRRRLILSGSCTWLCVAMQMSLLADVAKKKEENPVCLNANPFRGVLGFLEMPTKDDTNVYRTKVL